MDVALKLEPIQAMMVTPIPFIILRDIDKFI